MHRMTPEDGITLMELIVVVTIIGIFVVTSYPMLRKMRQRQRFQTTMTDIYGLCEWARSEAISRNRILCITVAPWAKGLAEGVAFENRITIFEDEGGTGFQLDPGETVLRRFDLPPFIKVAAKEATAGGGTTRSAVQFNPMGVVNSTQAQFAFVGPEGSVEEIRFVYPGRILFGDE